MPFHDTCIDRERAPISSARNAHWTLVHGLRVLSLSAPFYWLAGAIARARQRRKSHRILSALSDRALDDIGLTRADVNNLVRESAATAATRLKIAAHLGDSSRSRRSFRRKRGRPPWSPPSR